MKTTKSMEEVINTEIQDLAKEQGLVIEKISDGYHTFKELYDHRIALFIALCHVLDFHSDLPVWKSRKHHDDTSLEGWFIAGIGKEEGHQISYHLPNHMWDMLEIKELEKAPEWDGHTPDLVVKRLLSLTL